MIKIDNRKPLGRKPQYDNLAQRTPTLIRSKTVGQKTSVVISVSGGGFFVAVHQVYDGIDWNGINYLESESTWSDEQDAIAAHDMYLNTQIDRSI